MSLPRHILNGVLIRRSIASDLCTAIFPSLSVVLSLCDVPKTVFLENQNGGTSSCKGGHSILCPLVATALIVTLKTANKKTRMNISHFCFMFFNLKIYGKIVTNLEQIARGGVEVEDTRLKAKDTKKIRGQGRTALPRTDPLEAKDRNA